MKILIVEADRSLVEALTLSLEIYWDQVQVVSAADGPTGLQLFCREAPDLTLLDMNLPGDSGWAMLPRARAVSTAPVIILIARGQELDKIKGLELGADDYLTKPFSHLELFARIKAVLRRTQERTGGPLGPPLAVALAGDDRVVNVSDPSRTLAGIPLRLMLTADHLRARLARHARGVLLSNWYRTRCWGAAHL